ncbi:MAG: c-type cytochrome [Bryobacteraceae bacterium]
MRFSLVVFLALPALAQSDKIARGKYLAEEVSRCQECHTPRLPDGGFDRSKWMKGAVLNVQPIAPIKDWHKTSPDLTRPGSLWKKWGERAILDYLKTGLTPKGTHAGPPMPTYTLKPEDAEAVVEYLKSLP